VRNRSLKLLQAVLFVVICAVPAEAYAQGRASNGDTAAQPKRLGKPSTPPDARGRAILASADRAQGRKILVSTEDRWLWLVSGRDTLMSVPVGIGMRSGFEFEGKKFWFETPRSERRVLSKEANPVWTPPEWHYLERAKNTGLSVVRLTKDTKHLLDDGSFILTIGNNVGRLNQFGNFYVFPPGMEIIFDGKVFIPPMGTAQRRVPEALGPYKLDTGDGYLIHGTNLFNEDTVGGLVSHGCVRLTNEDLEKLYPLVPVGTPVYIF
jgi:lipoprotein-anchoring transpeptidase ErfK/SrfK